LKQNLEGSEKKKDDCTKSEALAFLRAKRKKKNILKFWINVDFISKEQIESNWRSLCSSGKVE
jgi:hypothetical protein